ncbi:hypothetical protein IGI04_012174 [Brassica rapa subsp. trilocularis]|uniref:Uncharacterized protein n=1 Tax=Brassica rapa subsp. trilocularis TaxID=1813537 RepID=A0ABQ7N574_BRACM|nr:hypothetical protein IGI04_012174 [Brassica rapa subsp. trilocularis]
MGPRRKPAAPTYSQMFHDGVGTSSSEAVSDSQTSQRDGAQLDPTKVSPLDEAFMVEPEANFGRVGRSGTYLGELVELNRSDTYISELSELSDTSLELNELSDTEEGACLVFGRNEPFSAQGKIHNKFNLGWFYTKFDQAFADGLMPICIKKYQQKESKSWSYQGAFNNTLISIPEVPFAFSDHIQHPAKVILPDFGSIKLYHSHFGWFVFILLIIFSYLHHFLFLFLFGSGLFFYSLRNPRGVVEEKPCWLKINPALGQLRRIHTKISSLFFLFSFPTKMFGLLKKSKPQQDVYFPFKTVFEKEQLIFDKKQFASNGFDFVQKQKKRQNRCDDEKWAFADGLMPICIKKYQQKESKLWSYQGAFNNTLISSQKWLALDRGYIKSIPHLLTILSIHLSSRSARALNERRAALGMPIQNPEDADPDRSQPSTATDYFDNM